MGSMCVDSSHSLVGESPQICQVRRHIDKLCRSKSPVLLLGESGTGKEVVARAIHNANPTGNFIPIDCGSLVGPLMESELFGHTRGAFTGAAETKRGLIELADGGTAFFDEIGDLTLEMQVKLLRLLQEREFRAVGSLATRKVEIRVIAATHRDLMREVEHKTFRQDLFYRLNVVTLRLPPLRERSQDIPPLIERFLERLGARHKLTNECRETLMSYEWPGNVRELQNCIERVVAMNVRPAAADQRSSVGAPNAFAGAALGCAGGSGGSGLGRDPASNARAIRYHSLDGDGEASHPQRSRVHQGRPRHGGLSARHRAHHSLSKIERVPSGQLRIALDATYSVGENLSGVGVYSRELLRALAAAHLDREFDFCYRAHRYLRSFGAALPPNARRRLLYEPLFPRSRDFFHGLNQRLPNIRFHKTVSTFHDLFVLTGDYSTPEFRHRFAEQAQRAAVESDAIIAVSAFTARQVEQLLGVDRGRIVVVHHGVNHVAPAQPATRENIVLNVGAIQRRKNIARLVEAFERTPKGWKLVLAGSEGFGASEILARIASSPRRGDIQVLGYVAAPELARWYSRARIFAFPSLDEGFGMPVLEAMAAGVPVIAGNRAALPEICGEAALLVDPEDVEAIASALVDLIRDEALTERLIRCGTERAMGFSWGKAAEETWQVYRRLAD